jgi:hypothetical protein
MHNIVSKNTYKVVQFDSSVDWEEEHLRTERGFQSRRERKERKQMEDRNRQNKIDATVDIIHQQQRSTSLVALARRARTVHSLLGIILDLFGVHENNDIATRLATFRNMPLNNIHDSLNEETEGIIIALFGVTAFFNTFRAYLPSTVVTSSEDDDDSPRSRRRRRRQRSWRQTEENVNKRQRRENH